MASSPTAAPVRLTVQTSGGPYHVDIAPGLAGQLAGIVEGLGRKGRRFLVSCPTVWRHHGHRFAGLTGEEPILIPDGERFKTMATVARIYDALVKSQADRGSLIIAVGGGVVGDVAGFAAATFLRGIPVVHVPTTLLAQVDSAIGGKVGVNHPLGKNLIGAFHPPSAVAIDPLLLETLPRREFRSGLYEIVKYGVIASPDLFRRIDENLDALFARAPAALVPAIAESCRIKASVVQEDEREAGPRRILNFGHTAGHALEAVTKYRRFRHGEAIAYGMLVAAEIAVARGVIPREDREALGGLIVKLGPLPPVADLEIAAVCDAIARDKKVVAGTLHFVLPLTLGRTAIASDVTTTELQDALRAVGLR